MKKIKFLLPPLFTALILALIFHKINFSEVLKALGAGEPLLFALAVILFLSSIFLTALRWKTLLGLAGCRKNYSFVLKTYLASVPIAKVTPSNTGDFIRAFYLKDELPMSKSAGIITAEIITDFIVLSLLALLGGIIMKAKVIIIASLLILAGAALFLIISARLKMFSKIKTARLGERIENFSQIYRIILKNYPAIFTVLFYTFLIWLIMILVFKILFLALGVNIAFLKILAVQSITVIFGLLPVTVSGVGLRETSMIFWYQGLASASSVLAAGLIYSFLALFFLPLLCLPFAFHCLTHFNKPPKF